MKLLVTGGLGFIGSNFIRYWVEKYPLDSIVNLDAETYAANHENLREVESGPKYTFIKGNICDRAAVDQAMAGVDAVVHFAAESHVDRSITGPAVFVTTNVIGTQVLLDAAVKNKIKRFHHISTDEVYGALPLDTKDKFSETTKYNPNSPYSASKAGSDHLVHAYHVTYGLETTISNTSNNYGPFQFPEKLIPLCVTNLIEGKKAPVYGDGLYVRDWLYVDDHCRGIDLVLEKGRSGGTYCLGGLTEDINNLEVVKKILKIMGRGESEIEFVADRPGHDRRYALDWSKAKRELGYRPRHDFDTYLEQTVKWYADHDEWWRPLKHGQK